LISLEHIKAARKKIKNYAVITPLQYSRHLSEMTKASVYLKLESAQKTGSFKVRGALNKLFSLSPEDLRRGVITASTGNHGLGFTFAAKQLGISPKVVFPIGASEEKMKKMKEAGAEIIQEVGYEKIEEYAQDLAKEQSLTYISPYNDPDIIAGAGTTGLEILEQLDNVYAIIVPIGGGGLISGIAIAVKSLMPDTLIIGVQSEASPEVYESWQAGHWVEAEETDSLAQGLMGGVESDSITLDIINKYVDKIVLVSEKAISEAMILLYEQEGLLIEGAGAISAAAIMKYASDFEEKRVVTVLSGGNIREDAIIAMMKV